MMSTLTRRAKEQMVSAPLLTWVSLGFFITYVLFYIVPGFLNSAQAIPLIQTLPAIVPIGFDFRGMVALTSTWLQTGIPPTELYPAFSLPFFAWSSLFSIQTGYRILIAATLLSFMFNTLIVPRWIQGTASHPALTVLLVASGLISYGLQFELERGQWNLIAFAFCLAGIYFFHHQKKRRWLAYLLFSISIQLKLFPAIFVFTLVDDWRDWKSNIRRLLGLGLINVLALFLLGVQPVVQSIALLAVKKDGRLGRPFNASIASFTIFILSSGILPQHKEVIAWLLANIWIFQLLLLVFFLICFLIIMALEYRKHAVGLSPYVLLACSIGALIIPSISFDYKLSFLPACVALFLPSILDFKLARHRLRLTLLLLIFSLAYSSVLYSYVYKPVILQNNVPALLILLLTVMGLSAIRPPGVETGPPDPAPPSFEAERSEAGAGSPR